MHDTWAACRVSLKARLTENKYKTWIEPLKPLCFDDGILVLGCPNPFFVSWVKQNYITEITSVVRSVTGDAGRPADVPPRGSAAGPETGETGSYHTSTG